MSTSTSEPVPGAPTSPGDARPPASASGCLTEARLLDVVEGLVTPAQLPDIVEHLDTCAACRETTKALQEIVGLLSPRGTRQPARPEMPAMAAMLDGYRIVSALGQGGQGLVYLAYDTLLERSVAIKLLLIRQSPETERRRILHEARAIARLQHPNVVTIYQVGDAGGMPYLVTELISGQSLREIDKPVTCERALALGLGLARGLAAAHRQSILHRDIKSSNAMLTPEGEAKLIDFGLAWLGPSVAEAAPDNQMVADGRDPGDPPLRLPAGDTQAASVMLGTPAYMAPELHRGEPATRRSDVYALGTVLYELCIGYPPAEDPTLASFLQDDGGQGRLPVPPVPVPPVQTRRPEVSSGFAAIIDRCLLEAPEQRFASAEELLSALTALAALETALPPGSGDTPATPLLPQPYRGLRAFDSEHRAFFFGRNNDISAVLERLRSDPLVVITGDSGLGKSSLCRAGVLPRVRAGALGLSRSWSTAVLSPGRRPLHAVAAAVAGFLGELATESEEHLAQRMADDPVRLVRQLRAHVGRNGGLLLMIDQLEELFAPDDPAAAEAEAVGRFLGALVAGASASLRLLVTVRGDFLTRLAALPGLGSEVARALYLLGPLGAESVREAIVGPARVSGARFESDTLVDTLVAAAGQQGGGLPLLQFVLAALWEARDLRQNLLTTAALADLGGVAGALGRHGDSVLASFSPAERTMARRMLSQLVSPAGTRVGALLAELTGDPRDPRCHRVLEALVHRRLVSVTGTGEQATYALAHETLLRNWSTLAAWIDADHAQRPLRQRVMAAAAEWQRLGRVDEALWRGRQLADVATLDPGDLGTLDGGFLAASRRLQRRRRWQGSIALCGMGALLALGYVQASLRAQRSLDRAVAGHVTRGQRELETAFSLAAESLTARKQAFAAFDASRATDAALHTTAEPTWQRARRLASQADAHYTLADQAFEAAYALLPVASPHRESLAAERAGILYRRILAAETTHLPVGTGPGIVHELRRRLESLDPQAAWRRHLDAPATFGLTLAPSTARCRLDRYRVDANDGGGPGEEIRPMDLEMIAPIVHSMAPMSLGAGSYRLACDAPDHVALYYPFWVGRGDHRQVTLVLPPAGAVKSGYVYIPPGDFLFGSHDTDDLRLDYFRGPPEHRVATAGYLIGRTEVTYADWIEFLEALSPAERARRGPQGIDSNLIVRLDQVQGRWRFTFHSEQEHLSAGVGEQIHYRHRSRRADQDWRRFPVAGISRDDATVYLAWLDRSGRLPGARLCSEREWERAARGADARQFPHGDRLLPDDANFDETYDRRSFGPDEVGAHPASASPFGVLDLTGNVWEWVESTEDPREALHRGGTWWDNRLTGRSVNREISQATVKNPLIGLRVCASYPLPSR